MIRPRHFIALFLPQLALLLAVSPAFAVSSGTIEGTLTYHNKNGQYCRSDQYCTDASYLHSDFDSTLPIAHTIVRVLMNGVIVGTGSTDVGGNFSINWYYPHSGYPSTAVVRTFLRHKDGRFQIWDADGTDHYLFTTTGVVHYGTTDIGSPKWGSSAAPNVHANAYAAAWRTWYYAFRHSNRMLAHFNDLDIFVEIDPNDQPEPALFFPSRFEIGLNTNRDFSYGAMYHEMGHAASYVASPGQSVNVCDDYCWPNTGWNCSWTKTAPEWGCAGFEEAFATFVGNVSAYGRDNFNATHCSQGGQPCNPTYGHFDDVSWYQGSLCSGNDDRVVNNTTRWLRDLYDTDGPDGISYPLYTFFDSMNDFASNTYEGGKNEPWNPFFTGLDDRDGGRSARDFRDLFDAYNGVSQYDSNIAFTNNCSPVGD